MNPKIQFLLFGPLAIPHLVSAALISPRDVQVYSPQCLDYQGEPFPAMPVEEQINEFCGNGSGWWWNDVLASPVSVGTGRTDDGRMKIEGVTNNYTIVGTTDRLWIGLMYDQLGSCHGTVWPTTGSTDQYKIDTCVERLKAVLNQCQTWTINQKTGGELHEECRVYAITARSAGVTPWTDWFDNLGSFTCKDTDEQLLTGNDGDLVGSCTCYYSGYPRIWDYFRKPTAGCNAEDVDKTQLIRN
ncbi:hypothetical protein F5Y19DRAFT_472888 [Xylariaceae sp. FL1651]|nr:hypothetical protein F5Y19DRAFT_472888 [Xylariaceae sp. FL1651]